MANKDRSVDPQRGEQFRQYLVGFVMHVGHRTAAA
jgi:hypothetical protein